MQTCNVSIFMSVGVFLAAEELTVSTLWSVDQLEVGAYTGRAGELHKCSTIRCRLKKGSSMSVHAGDGGSETL